MKADTLEIEVVDIGYVLSHRPEGDYDRRETYAATSIEDLLKIVADLFGEGATDDSR